MLHDIASDDVNVNLLGKYKQVYTAKPFIGVHMKMSFTHILTFSGTEANDTELSPKWPY